MSSTIHRPSTSSVVDEPRSAPRRSRGERLRGIGGRISLSHGLMVVAALVTFVAVSSVLRERGSLVEIAVADRTMLVGSTVTPADVRVVAVEADSPLLDRFVPMAEFRSSRLSRSLAPGDPLLSGDLDVRDVGDVARSVAIELDPVVVAALDLRVGDEVDIIGSDAGGRIGFVRDGLLVLRVGSPQSTSGAFDRQSRASFIVVQVTPAQAVDLATAQRSGSIDIVRSTGTDALDLETLPSGGVGS